MVTWWLTYIGSVYNWDNRFLSSQWLSSASCNSFVHPNRKISLQHYKNFIYDLCLCPWPRHAQDLHFFLKVNYYRMVWNRLFLFYMVELQGAEKPIFAIINTMYDRHYVSSQCHVWLPNFPHKAWVDPGEGSFTCQVNRPWVAMEPWLPV